MQDAPLESARIVPAKLRLLRIGSAMLGFGVTVALVAAIIGGTNPGANVNPIRVTGGIIMVAGLVTLLAGYRLAWVRELWRQRPRRTRRWFGDLPALSRFFCTVLPAIVGALAVLWTLLYMIPSFLAGLVILALVVLIPVTLAVVVAEGRGYQRTFCLGALFPTCAYLLLAAITFGQETMMMSQGRAIGPPIEEVGESYVAAGLVWLLALFTGLFAVGMRVLIERLQPPERRWRE